MDSEARRRTALVTGSARRVGRRIAHALVEAGWTVLIHARQQRAARATADELGAVGGIGADLADPEALERLVVQTISTFPDGLGLLVNSAASFERPADWTSAGIDGWSRAMDVNARAPYLLMSQLAPALERARGGVVNISDEAAHHPWGTAFPIHAASKAALESLTITGARALAPRGIHVNAVVPSTILAPDAWDEARIERERAAGRLGTPDELVRVVLELGQDPTRSGEIITL